MSSPSWGSTEVAARGDILVAQLRGVIPGEKLFGRYVGEVRVADPVVQVPVGELLRLGFQVDAIHAERVQGGEVEAFEDV